MSARTVAIGDIHGDLVHLLALWDALPALDGDDTLVFLGDYVDRGPDSAGVVRWIRDVLPMLTDARVVCLRGNHEDAWVRGQVFATDTGCGKGGFLTAVMFPGRVVYESRRAP